MPRPRTIHIFPYPVYTEERPRWWCRDWRMVTDFEHHPTGSRRATDDHAGVYGDPVLPEKYSGTYRRSAGGSPAAPYVRPVDDDDGTMVVVPTVVAPAFRMMTRRRMA